MNGSLKLTNNPDRRAKKVDLGGFEHNTTIRLTIRFTILASDQPQT